MKNWVDANYADFTHGNEDHDPDFATVTELDGKADDPHGNEDHNPNFAEVGHGNEDHTPDFAEDPHGNESHTDNYVTSTDFTNHDHSGTHASSTLLPNIARISDTMEIPVRSSEPSTLSGGMMWIRDDK